MRTLLLSLSFLFCLSTAASAQSTDIPKGSKLFLEQSGDTQLKDSIPDVLEDLTAALNKWGYFTLVAQQKEADYTLHVDLSYMKDDVLSSFSIFNRKAVIVDAEVLNPSRQQVWTTEKFKIGQQGMVGYNIGKAAMKTLVKRLKKDLK